MTFYEAGAHLKEIVAALFLMLPAMAEGSDLTLLAGGDVTWSRGFRGENVSFDEANGDDPDWRAVPRVNTAIKPRAEKKSFDYQIKFATSEDALWYPFLKMIPVFRAADLVFVNLETPLTDTAKWVGDYRTPANFAEVMKRASVSLVSLANNHTYDCEAQGLVDTIKELDAVGIGHVGAGVDLSDARKPLILEKHGIKVGFLGYTQFSNMGEAAFASKDGPGVVPMDPDIIREDLRALRPMVDFVVVAIHWGTSTSNRVSPKNREFAHEVIDDGADIILGGHSPHAKGIEIYKKKIIIYSQGHVIAGHQHIDWGDNYLVRFTLSPSKIKKLEVLPLAGTGEQLAQPFLLKGHPAEKLLKEVQSLSSELRTNMSIKGNIGIIEP